MSFEHEVDAFRAYAKAMPNNCVFLVDTYDTVEGVKTAVKIGLELRKDGYELAGIRLDSGDLAYLSIEARRILDEGGFPKALIVASNDLDEQIIASLKEQGAKIDLWGVGTKMVTAYDQPAMGGVYKMGAIQDEAGHWRHTIKISEQPVKVSNPGVQQVRRFFHEGRYCGDMIYNLVEPMKNSLVIVDPVNMTRSKKVPAEATYEDLLVPIFKQGELIYKSPSVPELRQRTREQLTRFHPGTLRFLHPHEYPVGLEVGLHRLKTEIILKARGLDLD
jgi:nicotinate phosphoribosyltransferase